MTGLPEIGSAAGLASLEVLGAFHPDERDAVPGDAGTLVLLGPAQPGFWDAITAAPEFRDGRGDPVDRWSRRVVGGLAEALGARALFPFDGPPWLPFYSWALRTGRAWRSPVALLVHDSQGLWVSFRGALAFAERLELPDPGPCPCDGCPRPCLTACPAGAMSGAGYALDSCHAFLNTGPGEDCMDRGCAVRRVCPLSAAHARPPEQSAYHMRQFHR